MGILNRILSLFRKTDQEKTTPPPHIQTGRRGEKEALRYLKKNGYTILERNFRTVHGEIDIVAFQDGVVVFAEVRSRTEPFFSHPLTSITSRKKSRLLRTSRAYCKRHYTAGHDITTRFDVIGVTFRGEEKEAEIEHVKAAFRA